MEHPTEFSSTANKGFLSGQALLETALVLPLLLLIIMGVFDLGRGIYAYNVISNSAREAARYGIVHARIGSPPSLDRTNIRATAFSK